jgi:hypothetical protein
MTTTTAAQTTNSTAALWADLVTKNAKVLAETRAALRTRSGPPSRKPGSNYAAALEAHRLFWAQPDAHAHATQAAGGGAARLA